MTCNSQRKREEEEEGARTGWHGICNIRRIMGFSLMLLLSFFTGAESTTTTSSVLMYHSNECFVSQYYPTTCHGSRRNNPFLSSSLPRKFDPLLFVGTSSKPNRQRKSIILRTSSEPTKSPLPNNTNNNLDDKNFNDPKKIIPTTFMYTIVPFLPSITIQSLNDHYQQLKQQFNIAAAALPPSAPTDSIEYITASNMYNESMQSLLVLLLSKRVALYFLATLATVYAGWRASITIGAIERGDLGGPGMALDYLNREVLKGEKSAWLLDDDGGGGVGGNNGDDANATVDVGSESEKKVDDDDNDKLFATLVDDSPQSTKVGGAIAIILPLVLGASLTLSYTLISFFKGVGVDGSSISSSIIGDEYLSAIQGLLPYLTSIPSMVLCVLFVATEFRSVSSSSSSSSSTSTNTSLLHAENVAALLYVAGAYIAKVYPTITIGGEWNLDLGPLQNGVNIAFAATVVRALSPFLISYTSTLDESSSTSSSKMPSISIRTMALALIGVTMFDGISVFGTVANAATVDATTSVMETVATYKADAQLWNPGLLSVVVGHNQNAKITEALGLGDVVFPACLVAWGFFADAIGTPTNDASDEAGGEMPKRQISYTTATTAGYVLGSAATEIVGTFSLLGSGRGLPALIFLIPSMLIAVTTVAVSRGELNEVWGRSDVAESNASD